MVTGPACTAVSWSETASVLSASHGCFYSGAERSSDEHRSSGSSIQLQRCAHDVPGRRLRRTLPVRRSRHSVGWLSHGRRSTLQFRVAARSCRTVPLYASCSSHQLVPSGGRAAAQRHRRSSVVGGSVGTQHARHRKRLWTGSASALQRRRMGPKHPVLPRTATLRSGATVTTNKRRKDIFGSNIFWLFFSILAFYFLLFTFTSIVWRIKVSNTLSNNKPALRR